MNKENLNNKLLKAIVENDVDKFKYILNNELLLLDDLYHSYKKALLNGKYKFICCIIDDDNIFKHIPNSYIGDTLNKAIPENEYTVIKKIYENRNINIKEIITSSEANYLFKYAVNSSHWGIIEVMLMDDRIDVVYQNNKLLRYAAHFGHTNVVEKILKYPNVDPSANNNEALNNICFIYSRKDIAKLLFKDYRLNLKGLKNCPKIDIKDYKLPLLKLSLFKLCKLKD